MTIGSSRAPNKALQPDSGAMVGQHVSSMPVATKPFRPTTLGGAVHAPPPFRFEPKERLTADGYLTPVYFNKEVLVRYSYDSRFSCE